MGRRKRSAQLTPLELQIMQVLWDRGPSTVQCVQENLPGSQRLAYTTVQTMLNVLQKKGRVKRVLRGRAFEYRPVLSQESAASHAVRDVVDRLFGGSVEGLLMSLVKNKQLDPKELDRISEKIEQFERSQKKENDDGND